MKSLYFEIDILSCVTQLSKDMNLCQYISVQLYRLIIIWGVLSMHLSKDR